MISVVSRLQLLSGNNQIKKTMHIAKNILLVFLVSFLVQEGNSQIQTPVKIAVFAPLYIDSAFKEQEYKLGKNNLPKYMLAGLDFYNGVQLAIDSLQAEKQDLEVMIFDSKMPDDSLEALLSSNQMQDVGMMIASFNNRNEIGSLSDFALEKNIPLLSATFPNDGGITENPFFVMLNPSLHTHLEALHKFLRRTYPTNNIQFFRRKGNAEDMIQQIFMDLNAKATASPLKIKVIELPDSIIATQVTDYLDTNRLNVVVCGSLNETFGSNLSKALSSSKKYKNIAIGMPTWDAIRDISNNLDIVYTTPYNFNRAEDKGIRFTEKYNDRFATRPSDMSLKGFETMYHFARLLIKYQQETINHLSDKEFKVFHDFDIQLVKRNVASSGADYRENKKLLLIRKVNGKIKSSY